MRYWALLYAIVWFAYGMFYFFFFTPANKVIGLILLLLWGLSMWIFAYIPKRINARLHRKVLDHGYQICIHCGYSLRELPTQHRCPECGNEYTFMQLEHDWKKWYSVKSD